MNDGHLKDSPTTIFIVSGGAGASGEQLVNTVLAQFPRGHIQTITIPHVRSREQVSDILLRAKQAQAILAHTLVDHQLREFLVSQASQQAVVTVDLMGPLIERLSLTLGQAPVEQPGLYRQLNKAYFERVEAIEYTMAHDDGKSPPTWLQAEIVLVGASRVGKTPLSLYLSVLGWKVANVPVVPGLNLPGELYQLDRQRVFGLKIEVGQILALRQRRQQRLGVSGPSDYTDPEKVYEELEYTTRLCKKAGFTMIDVTDRPIETSADEIIRLMTSRFETRDRRG